MHNATQHLEQKRCVFRVSRCSVRQRCYVADREWELSNLDTLRIPLTDATFPRMPSALVYPSPITVLHQVPRPKRSRADEKFTRFVARGLSEHPRPGLDAAEDVFLLGRKLRFVGANRTEFQIEHITDIGYHAAWTLHGPGRVKRECVVELRIDFVRRQVLKLVVPLGEARE